ncbi:hypothetical protein C0J50_14745, partial [Silurus asotus]
LIYQFCHTGILFYNTWAWSVTMPQSIHGLQKSCLVIPCSFDYSSDPPKNPYQIVWYQLVDRGYPVVFDSWNPASVIDRYKGRTSLYKQKFRGCSLLIEVLSLSHSGDKIYAWVDPENIGWTTYKFYDVSTIIYVDSSAEKPRVQISGGDKIGDRIKVQCTTYHTCPYKPPSFSLKGIEKSFGKDDKLLHIDNGDGKWEITLTREGVVQSETQEIQCSVRHSGGLTASTTKIHTAQCTIDQPNIADLNTEFLEGVQQNIVCSVTYGCSSYQPQILWNDENLHESITFISTKGIKHEAKSTLKFTAKANDNGKTITCETRFKGSSQRAQMTLRVKSILFHNTWAWSVTMPYSIRGLQKSCLVIPCSFYYSSYPPMNPYRIVWYEYVDRGYPAVFDSWDPASVIDRYKGRTSLYKPTFRGCSLLIKDLSLSHSGDRIYAWVDPENIGWRTYEFFNVSIIIYVDSSAEKPRVHISGGAKIGDRITIKCTAYHTCPYEPPSLSLKGIEKHFEKDDTLLNRDIDDGKWEITLTREGIVQSETQTIECSVRHSGGLTASTTKIHAAQCK